jgi:hypothetical protein
MNIGVPTLEARARHETCLSDLTLDRLVGAEITATDELAAIEAHLSACALCSRRRSEIEASPIQVPDREWLSQVRATPPARRRPLILAGGALAVAAMAALVLVVKPKAPAPTPREGAGQATAAAGAATEEATTRTKGSALALDLFVRRGDLPAEPVFSDVPLRAGDAIRFRVRAPEDGYLAVIGLDSEGKVSRYSPAGGEAAAPFKAGERAVDGSVILDDAPGEEKVIALLCPDPAAAATSVAAARAALAAAGAPSRVASLPGPCRQAAASFRKEARR